MNTSMAGIDWNPADSPVFKAFNVLPADALIASIVDPVSSAYHGKDEASLIQILTQPLQAGFGSIAGNLTLDPSATPYVVKTLDLIGAAELDDPQLGSQWQNFELNDSAPGTQGSLTNLETLWASTAGGNESSTGQPTTKKTTTAAATATSTAAAATTTTTKAAATSSNNVVLWAGLALLVGLIVVHK